MESIIIKHFSFHYPNAQLLLSNVNLHFYSRTINLITGPSGTGKSTFLKLIAGFHPQFIQGAVAGQIMYNRRTLSTISDNQLHYLVSILFQDPAHQFSMDTVKHELIFTLENQRVPSSKMSLIIRSSLHRIGITDLMNRKLITLSGGEKQKVAIAIAIAMDTDVILLDEPFANIDQSSRTHICQQLTQLKNQGKTIIIVDHHPNRYQRLIDHQYFIHNHTIQAVTPHSPRTYLRSSYRFRLPNHSQPVLFHLKSLKIQRNQHLLLQIPHFNFYSRCITLLTGSNGSGKSTLFKTLIKLFAYRGIITYLGHDIQHFKKRQYYQKVGLIPQNADDQFIKITVAEDIEISIRHAVRKLYSRATILYWLKRTGLTNYLHRSVYILSGGQKKALEVIELLITGVPTMLMDEPFQNMDQRQIRFFAQLLPQIVRKHSTTMIIISHQLDNLVSLFDYHAELKNTNLSYTRKVR